MTRERAILKAADYLPVIEGPDDEYPLQLSTGRLMYHFHTRTKTGRSKELEDAAFAPRVEISEADARALNVEEEEQVTIRSRGGAVQMPVTITKIAKGQIFIPFHYGYFDASNKIARAANELTQELWDPISKQPLLKSGAVKVEKCRNSTSEAISEVKEQQFRSVQNVESSKPNAKDIKNLSPRRRFLDHWMTITLEAIDVLVEICDRLIPDLVHDLEVNYGIKIMRRISEDIRSAIKPYALTI